MEELSRSPRHRPSAARGLLAAALTLAAYTVALPIEEARAAPITEFVCVAP